jgi:ribonucleoside-diphosphate reductase beta chain
MDLTKYVLRTEKDPESWQFYKKQEACDWSAEEFDFTKEKQDYLQAPDSIKKLLKGIFGFFLIGDGLISEDMIKFLKEEIEAENWPKVYYLSMQLKIENTHAETYSKAALTIIPEEEHPEIVSMCKELPCIQMKGEWIKKHIDSQESKALRYVACAVGEGVFFVSLFAVIFYLRKLNLFKNFIESNEQISKDESIHRDEKAMEAKRSLKPEEHQRAIQIIKDGVEVEKEHAKYLLSHTIMGKQADEDAGLTISNLNTYIEMLADQVALLSGLPIIYDVKAELPWMEDIVNLTLLRLSRIRISTIRALLLTLKTRTFRHNMISKSHKYCSISDNRD